MAKLDFSKVGLLKDDTDISDLIPSEIDTSKFVDTFKRHEQRIAKMNAEAAEYQINDDITNEGAVSRGANAAAAIKELNSLRDRIIKPWKQAVKSVTQACKMYTERLETIKGIYGTKHHMYEKAERVKKEAMAKKQREEAEKLQKKLDKDAKRLGVEAPAVQIPEVDTKALTTPVKTEKGTAYQKKIWKYEVEDLKKVPRKYLQLNKSQVTKDIRAHTSDGQCDLRIPGIRIYQKEDTVFRTG